MHTLYALARYFHVALLAADTDCSNDWLTHMPAWTADLAQAIGCGIAFGVFGGTLQ